MRSWSPCSIICKPIFLATLATLVLTPNHVLAGRLLQSDGGFKTWNDTIADANSTMPDRRSTLGFGESAPVTVTFYSTPGMDCATGNGMCGFGSDTTGDTDFVKNSLYPLHVASGNFGFLGGCGSCLLLSYNGKSRGYVISDITDPIDELGQRDWPPQGSHIDMCCNEFDYFQSLDHGSGIDCNNGGIFTGTMTRVPCETLGAPNYPDNDHFVVRTEAWNKWAKAVVVSRLPGVGEIDHVDFETRNGGFRKGEKVQGWGSWITPGADLSGQGGVGLIITMVDGTVIKSPPYAMPDFNLWKTGDVYNIPLPVM